MCRKMIGLKFDTAAKRWYLRECEFTAPSANSSPGWLHEIQELGTVAHTPRSGRSPMSNDGVTRIENVF